MPETVAIPTMSISDSDLMAISSERSDAGVFILAEVIGIDVPIKKSSWIALRIFPSSHPNPIFAIVDGKPVRASRRSAQWCLAAVNQC